MLREEMKEWESCEGVLGRKIKVWVLKKGY